LGSEGAGAATIAAAQSWTRRGRMATPPRSRSARRSRPRTSPGLALALKETMFRRLFGTYG